MASSRRLSGAGTVFVHINAFTNRSGRTALNPLASYVLSTDKQGRPRVKKATLVGGDRRRRKTRRMGSLLMAAPVIFLCMITAAVMLDELPPLILAAYVTLSVVVFIFYAWDKSAAKRGAWRTKERTLHLLALVGGWPGAVVAQETLRHKSKKRSFRTVFWATVLLNVAGLVWLLTPSGTWALRMIADIY